MKVHRKPVMVEVVQFTGDNLDTISEFTKGWANVDLIGKLILVRDGFVSKCVRPGDWLVWGHDCCPCCDRQFSWKALSSKEFSRQYETAWWAVQE